MPAPRENPRPLGVVYTPPDVARAMTRLALAPLVDGKSSHDILALRICDPAAGTGAFLVEVVAYLADHLVAAWLREGRRPARTWADEARTLVAHTCIVGVDVDEDALHIAARAIASASSVDARLASSIDARLASSNDTKPASSIDPNLAASVDAPLASSIDPNLAASVDAPLASSIDPNLAASVDAPLASSIDATPRANLRVADALSLDWRSAFPAIFERGGFDVVLANPPYIRQESLGGKSTLEDFEVYDGVADLYVYFVELAHRLLRPRGRYCVIVPSKWMTVEYGRPLRTFLANAFTVDGIVDLSSHSLFANADAFPCIVWGTSGASRDRSIIGVRAKPDESVDDVLRRAAATASTAPSATLASLAPSAQSAETARNALDESVDPVEFAPAVPTIPRDRWTAEPWHIDSASDHFLLDRLALSYPTLGEIIGTRWSRGVVTGLNEAFVIDRSTRDALMSTDLACATWIRPFVKGRDIRPFAPAAIDRWLLLVDRGTPFDLLPRPIRDHLARFRDRLEPKPTDHAGVWPGRKPGSYAWHELQDPIVPLAKSRAPRLFYQDIQTAPACSFDPDGELVPDTTVWILPSSDRYLLAILNSRFYGWYAQRRFPPALNGAVRPKLAYMQRLPIPVPSSSLRHEIEVLVDRRLVTKDTTTRDRELLDRQLERLVEHAYQLSSIERALIAS